MQRFIYVVRISRRGSYWPGTRRAPAAASPTPVPPRTRFPAFGTAVHSIVHARCRVSMRHLVAHPPSSLGEKRPLPRALSPSSSAAAPVLLRPPTPLAWMGGASWPQQWAFKLDLILSPFL